MLDHDPAFRLLTATDRLAALRRDARPARKRRHPLPRAPFVAVAEPRATPAHSIP